MKRGMAPLTIIFAVVVAAITVWAIASIFFSGTDSAGNTLSNLTACESSLWKQAALAPDAEGATCALHDNCGDLPPGPLYIPLGAKGCPPGQFCCLVVPLEKDISRTVKGEDVVGGEPGEEYPQASVSIGGTPIAPEVKNARQWVAAGFESKHVIVKGPEGYKCRVNVKLTEGNEVGVGNGLETFDINKNNCEINEPLNQDNLFATYRAEKIDGKKYWVEITLFMYDPNGPTYGIEFMPAGGSHVTTQAKYYQEIT